MKSFARVLLAAAALTLGLRPSTSAAEDIDIYTGGGAATNPNVIFVIDNSSNWSAANQGWPTGKQGQSELNALRTLVGQLDDSVNVGLMLFTEGSNQPEPNGRGGYVRFHVRQMTTTNKAALQELIGTASCTAGNNSLNSTPNCIYKNFDDPGEKVSNSDYSAMMFEVFKYLGGHTSPARATTDPGSPVDASHFGALRYAGDPDAKSDLAAYSTDAAKKDYNPPITSTNNCAKTYVVFIGNGFPTSGSDSPSSLLTDIEGTASPFIAVPTFTVSTLTTTSCGTYPSCTAATDALAPNDVYNGVNYDIVTCSEITQGCGGGNKKHKIFGTRITGTSVPNSSKNRYADEWARYLYQTDVSPADGQQSVITFAIDVYKDQQDTDQTSLLMSMARAGGGKYFAATNEDEILSSLQKIMSEVQSVNSVFASSSLPVSVNTQGTYLNQVFIGMFRPDGQAQPRWAGNLKQYQFAFFADELKLADKNKEAAISATTGFITPCADSLWTSDSGTYWDFSGSVAKGLCTAQSSQFPAAGSSSAFSDAPDGDVVEKGGAAQRLRGVGSSGGTLTSSSTNYSTRSLKTCDGTSASTCTSFTNFDTANGAITDVKLGVAASERDNLIDWVRGKDVNDENGNGVSTEMRPSTHGDVVHSQPAVVDFGSPYGVIAFYGANSGVFHAVDGGKTDTEGTELWGFVAPETYGRLNRIRDNEPLVSLPGVSTTITPTPTPKGYFFDGSVGVFQRTIGTTQTVWIYPTMRRGGRAVYAFDVSNPNSPSIKWRKGCFTNDTSDDTSCSTGWSSIGQTWSKPQIGYVRNYVDGSSKPKPVLVFGGGYDTCEDYNGQSRCTTTPRKGAHVFFVDADTGSIIRTYPTNYSVPGDVLLLKDASGYIKYAYVGDSGGYVYRINVGTYDGTTASAWTDNSAAANITIADLSESSHARKFLFGPDVVEYDGYNAVLIGSGDRERPLEENYPCGTYSTTAGNYVSNQFYMLKDVTSGYPTTVPTVGMLTNVTSNLTATESDINAYGWMFSLGQCEQVVNKAITIGGVVYFGTNQPPQSGTASCATGLGTARGYAVDFLTANPVGALRFTEFVGGGMPPSPVAGIVDIDGQKVPFIIGGGAPSALEGAKVTINPKGTRFRNYWYIKTD